MIVGIESFKGVGEQILLYGQDVVVALFILVAGLIAAKIVIKYLKLLLQKVITNPSLVFTVCNTLYLLLVIIVIVTAVHHVGVPAVVIRRIFIAAVLIIVGMIVLFRPFIPSLPYKAGNTIEVGGNLGKVEATTLINTRLRTFDGRTLFIPNRMILNDIVNNFHFTPYRQVRVKVTIGYRDDLLRAKEVLKDIMESDPRVLKKPAPNVYVMELGENGVELSARCWLENAKYLRVRSDLTERIKLRFEAEGISIPFPQRHLHMDGGRTNTDLQDFVIKS